MKATEVKLPSFLQKSPQFIVSIYQRTYSWTDKHCRQSWDDILHAGPAPGLRCTSSVQSSTDQYPPRRHPRPRSLRSPQTLRFPCTGRTSGNLMPRSPDGIFLGMVTCHAKNFAHCGIDIIHPRTVYNGERINLMK
jgi:hypothetical protein